MRVAGVRHRKIGGEQIVLFAVRNAKTDSQPAQVWIVIVSACARGVRETHDGWIGGAGLGVAGGQISGETVEEAKLGTFQPIDRLHGNHSDRLPWQYGPAARASAEKFLNLRENLVPYTYSLAKQAQGTGESFKSDHG